jgi:LPXTG-site transpeptidase (sortase) family protein
MLGGRLTAALALTVGVAAAGAGAAGLMLTRHPQVVPVSAVRVLPAPTGPIVAAPQHGTASVAKPVSLVIPAIGVTTALIHLGLTSSGALQVPSSTSVAGWYTGSPRPGATGSSVIAGHIDSYRGPGIFFRLSDLRTGDKVYVKRADGTLAVFKVTAVKSYSKDKFPTAAVYGPSPDPELRLITCGGVFDRSLKSYLSNTVVYATETN